MSKNILTAVALTAMLAAAADDKALKKVAGDAISRVDELEKEQAEAVRFNEELQQELNQLKTGRPYRPSFKVGEKRYEVVHGVNHEGRPVSPKDIAGNAALRKKLIASQSSAIEEVPLEVTE